jgi:Tfp pilus assembly protein PilE
LASLAVTVASALIYYLRTYWRQQLIETVRASRSEEGILEDEFETHRATVFDEVTQPTFFEVALPLCKFMAPLLLTFVQLAASFVKQARKTHDMNGKTEEEYGDTSFGGTALEYIQVDIAAIGHAFRLECVMGYEIATELYAFAQPLLVLLILVPLAIVSVFVKKKRELAVQVSLQSIRILYVGGAVSTSNLLSCTTHDADGTPLLEQDQYLTALPFAKCDVTHSRVAEVAYTIAYVGLLTLLVVVPGYLLLIVRMQEEAVQTHLAMTQVAVKYYPADGRTLQIAIFLSFDSIAQEPQEFQSAMLMATASACAATVAMHLPVSAVRIEPEKQNSTGCLEMVYVRVTLAEDAENVISLRDTSYAVERTAVNTRLHAAWCLAVENSEVLRGARKSFDKYVNTGELMKMEILLKLGNFGLLALLRSSFGLPAAGALSFALSLEVAVSRPYSRQEASWVTALCYACLGLMALLAERGAKQSAVMIALVPFVLALALLWRIDKTQVWAEKVLQRCYPCGLPLSNRNHCARGVSLAPVMLDLPQGANEDDSDELEVELAALS